MRVALKYTTFLLLCLGYSNGYSQYHLSFFEETNSLKWSDLNTLDSISTKHTAASPLTTIYIISHVADIGYENRLNDRRIERARSYLMARGVDSNQIVLSEVEALDKGRINILTLPNSLNQYALHKK